MHYSTTFTSTSLVNLLIFICFCVTLKCDCFNIETRRGAYGIVNMTNGFNELSFYPSLAGFSSFVWTTGNKIQ